MAFSRMLAFAAVAAVCTGVVDAGVARQLRHGSFLAAGMQPEVVARTLVDVVDEWKAQAALFAECNSTGAAIVDCNAAPNAFRQSCGTVVAAVVQGSSGDRSTAEEYMGDVCGEKVLSGWRKERCLSLKDAVIHGMSADNYANREGVSSNSAKLCTGFWTRFAEEERRRVAEEEKVRAEEEKKAAEAAAAAKKKAEEEAEAEEKRIKAEAAKKAEEEAKAQAEQAAANLAAKKAEAEAVAKAAEAKKAEAEAAEKEHQRLLEKVKASKAAPPAATKPAKKAGATPTAASKKAGDKKPVGAKSVQKTAAKPQPAKPQPAKQPAPAAQKAHKK